jgi:hypothetical protein
MFSELGLTNDLQSFYNIQRHVVMHCDCEKYMHESVSETTLANILNESGPN